MVPNRTFSAVGPFPSLRHIHIAGCFCLMAFVTWGLLTPDPLASVRNTRLSFLQTVNDVLIHCSVYTVFSCACLSLLRRRTDTWVRTVVMSLLLVHGIGTELLQTLVPRRTGDPLDAIANITGIAIGALIATRLAGKATGRATVTGMIVAPVVNGHELAARRPRLPGSTLNSFDEFDSVTNFVSRVAHG